MRETNPDIELLKKMAKVLEDELISGRSPEWVPADLNASIGDKVQALKEKVSESSLDIELLKKIVKDLEDELMKGVKASIRLKVLALNGVVLKRIPDIDSMKNKTRDLNEELVKGSSLNWVLADLKASIGDKAQALNKKVGESNPKVELLTKMAKDLEEELMKGFSLEEQIAMIRDDLHHNAEGTIMYTHVLWPVLAHGSHLIYAPDEVVLAIASKVSYRLRAACHAAEDGLIVTLGFRDFVKDAVKYVQNNWPIVVSFIFGLYIFHEHGQSLKCEMQNTFVTWAKWNREVYSVVRFFSISVLMIVRLFVGNLFLFTSPAFAHIIAKSQPEGEEGLGALYLLACGMPAGALLPLLDTLVKLYTSEDFLATRYASRVTDCLPFSFWVRPFFMEPAFLAARKIQTTRVQLPRPCSQGAS